MDQHAMNLTSDELEQNTEEWKRWRKSKLGSSDAPVIMGVSKFSTRKKLFDEKLGFAEGFTGNWATERGTKWEPAARARYEMQSDLELPATIVVHPKYKFLTASLDGYNKEAQIILEIKIAGKEVFEAAKAGVCHEMYYPQVQHQLMVAGAREVHFYCCKVEKDKSGHERIVDDALVKVPADAEYQIKLLEAELAFHQLMEHGIAPALSDGDYLEADDQQTVMLFSELKKMKQEMLRKEELIARIEAELEEIELDFEDLREVAVEHVKQFKHPKVTAVGLNMTENKNGVWSVRLAADAEGE